MDLISQKTPTPIYKIYLQLSRLKSKTIKLSISNLRVRNNGMLTTQQDSANETTMTAPKNASSVTIVTARTADSVTQDVEEHLDQDTVTEKAKANAKAKAKEAKAKEAEAKAMEASTTQCATLKPAASILLTQARFPAPPASRQSLTRDQSLARAEQNLSSEIRSRLTTRPTTDSQLSRSKDQAIRSSSSIQS